MLGTFASTSRTLCQIANRVKALDDGCIALRTRLVLDLLAQFLSWLLDKEIVLAVAAWVVSKHLIEPRSEQMRLRGEIVAFMNQNNDLFSNPASTDAATHGPVDTDLRAEQQRRRREVLIEGRRLAAVFIASVYAYPSWARRLGVGFSTAQAKQVQAGLLGLVNGQYRGPGGVFDHVACEEKLWMALDLPADNDSTARSKLLSEHAARRQ